MGIASNSLIVWSMSTDTSSGKDSLKETGNQAHSESVSHLQPLNLLPDFCQLLYEVFLIHTKVMGLTSCQPVSYSSGAWLQNPSSYDCWVQMPRRTRATCSLVLKETTLLPHSIKLAAEPVAAGIPALDLLPSHDHSVEAWCNVLTERTAGLFLQEEHCLPA